MISLAEAQARLLDMATPLIAETVPIAHAIGRYLAEDITAQRTQPAADLSAMDGYAIRHSDLPGPWHIIGESAAGSPFSGAVTAGDAVRIFTGAQVPSGADTVIIQEDTQVLGSSLSLNAMIPIKKAQHIRAKGTDFLQGNRLLCSGATLNAGAIAVAAMAGMGALKVGKSLKISIIATGDELVSPGMPCTTAQIPSSNGVMLAAMLAALPCDVTDCGIISDDLPAIEAALLACGDADIIVTIGGASVGNHDLVQAALRNVGAHIDFWRVAIKPGKPLMAGKLKQSIVIGLPGNPSSAFVTAFLFLLPLIRHMAGSNTPFLPINKAILAQDIPATGNRAEFIRSHFDGETVHPLSRQDSGMVTPLSQANALIICPLTSPLLTKGCVVSYYPIGV
jgi:molybdopterin molybdotransferase